MTSLQRLKPGKAVSEHNKGKGPTIPMIAAVLAAGATIMLLLFVRRRRLGNHHRRGIVKKFSIDEFYDNDSIDLEMDTTDIEQGMLFCKKQNKNFDSTFLIESDSDDGGSEQPDYSFSSSDSASSESSSTEDIDHG